MKHAMLIAVLGILLPIAASAQVIYKIASKSNCNALVEVEMTNTITGAFSSVTVGVAPVDLVYINAPNSDPNWVVCGVGLLTGGGTIILPTGAAGCSFNPGGSGDPSACVNNYVIDPNSFYYWLE